MLNHDFHPIFDDIGKSIIREKPLISRWQKRLPARAGRWIVSWLAAVLLLPVTLPPAGRHPDSAITSASRQASIESLLEHSRDLISRRSIDSCLEAAREAESLLTADRIEDAALVEIENILGQCYWFTGNLSSCEYHLNRAMQLFKKIAVPVDSLYADIQFNHARLLFIRLKYDKAIDAAMEATRVQRRLSNHDRGTFFRSEALLASIYKQWGKDAQALEHYRRADSVREQISDRYSLEYIDGLGNMISVLYDQGQFSQSLSLSTDIFQLKADILGSQHPDIIREICAMGASHFALSEYIIADSLFARAIEICRRHPQANQLEYARALFGRGIVAIYQQQTDAAEPFIRSSLELYRRFAGDDNLGTESALIHLALIWQVHGDLVKAIELSEQALKAARKIYCPDDPRFLTRLCYIAGLYAKVGKIEEAKQLSMDVLERARKSPNPQHPFMARVLDMLAEISYEVEDSIRGVDLHRQALNLSDQVFGPTHDETIRIMFTLGEHYFNIDQIDSAKVYATRVIERTENLPPNNASNREMAFELLGIIEFYRGNYAMSEQHFRNAISIQDREKFTDLDLKATYEPLAVICAARNDYKASLDYYLKCIHSRQQDLQVLCEGTSEAGRLMFLKMRPIIINSLLSLALQSRDQDAQRMAFEMVLKGKGTILEAMSADKETILCSDDSALTSVWHAHSEISSQIANLMMANSHGRRYTDEIQSMKALWRIRDSLEYVVSAGCTQFRDRQLKSDLKTGDIAACLRDSVVLWEFLRYRPYSFADRAGQISSPESERYLAFTLNSDGQAEMIDLGDAGTIDSLVLRARSMIYTGFGDLYSPKASDGESRLGDITNQLYKRLIVPLQTSLAGKRVICVAPDGMLGLIPFEIIRADDGLYLIEHFQFQYLTVGRELLKIDPVPQSISSAVIVGDPDFDSAGKAFGLRPRFDSYMQIPATAAYDQPTLLRGQTGCLDHEFAPLWYGRKEATAIAGALRSDKSIQVGEYYGQEANEGLIKNLMTPPDILHLSTHGFYCPLPENENDSIAANPLLRSGLVLAGANNVIRHNERRSALADDGILTAFEVSALNLTGTQLVTLSACETGVGEPSQEMGIYGMRSAFLAAGAQSLLVSLWQVPDREAAEIMGRFYSYWLTGGSKAAALRKAELEMLRRSRLEFGHGYPLLWGSFILVGNPN